MMGVAKEVQRIKDEVGSKRVLLVEGPDDVPIVERFVWRALTSERASTWVIKAAGKKDSVRQMLRQEPTWKGIVDRDEWDQERIAAESLALPNLIVLPRFTIENFLVVPSELWPALPAARRSHLGTRDQLNNVVGSKLAAWVRHGVLWQTESPLWEGLRAKGFKESLASEESFANSQDDGAIRRTLESWQGLLDPDVLFQRYQNNLAQALGQPPEVQLKRFVHGKCFWEQVVYPILNIPARQISREELRKRLVQGHPGCPEFESLIQTHLG